MRARICGIILLSIALGSAAWAINEEEGNPGLRSAERVSPTVVRLLIGPGCASNQIGKKAGMFQVVSATDTDFQKGVRCASAKLIKTEADGTYPDGWTGPRFEKYTVEASLPGGKPMKEGHKYWIRIVSAWVIGRNHAGCWIKAPGTGTDEKHTAPRYGIRRVSIVSPGMIEVLTGAGLDLKRLSDLSAISVSSSDDPDFKAPLNPQKIGRRSHLDFYIPRDWPWKFRQKHYLYVQLPKAMKNGKTYTIDLNAKAGSPLCCGTTKSTLKVDDRESINLAIKVNQYGYLPDAKKYGYLGLWAGDMGAIDFASHAGTFEVRDLKTHKVVLTGTPTMRHKAGTKDETVYKQDLSFENTWQLDLSGLSEPGRYYVAIPGMGRSFKFRVGPKIYSVPFKILMYGLYHQRCGIELKEPWTKHYRPACHRNSTEYSTATLKTVKKIGELAKFATDGKKHDLYGGHHDAGDWCPRSHLDVARSLFLAYEINSKGLTDGQLRIPESKNGIPDILDEGFWALDLWFRLQDDDGGVHEHVETAGDPKEGDSAATDSLREFAYAKTPGGSYRFAAIATQASIIWKALGKTKKAQDFLDRAIKAWDWAEKNGGDKENDQHVFAAAMLLRATGEDKYNAAFKKHSVFSRNRNAELSKWQKHDQLFGSYNYALAEKADAELKKTIIAAFERTFGAWRNAARTTNYRYMRSPYSPNNWGTGGLPKYGFIAAMTMQLTADDKLKTSARQWILWSNDFSLGCHPMNLVFSVGVGQRYVTTAWHHLMHHSPEGLIYGLQSEGPGSRGKAGQHPGRKGMGKWPLMSLYPAGDWPDLYKYSEDASPGMNEGVAGTQAESAFSYALFVPVESK